MEYLSMALLVFLVAIAWLIWRYGRTIRWICDFIGRCLWLGGKDYWDMFTKRPKDITGKVVAITGGAHGIGKELAKILAIEKGARVAIVDIKHEECKLSAAELSDCGGIVVPFCADVADRKQMQQLAEDIENHEQLGKVDILICNAGVGFNVPIRDLLEEQVRRTMDVNFFGSLWTIQAFLGRMENRNSGHIVVINSVAGCWAERTGTAYCSSKYALRGMMEALELELFDGGKDGVHVTTAYPYFTDTALITLSSLKPTAEAMLPMQKAPACARAIIDGVLLDKVEVFVPSIYRLLCLLIKPFRHLKMENACEMAQEPKEQEDKDDRPKDDR